MTEQMVEDIDYGLGRDLGPGPEGWSKPHRVVKFADGLIRRVPEINLSPVWVASADLDGERFFVMRDTAEAAEEALVAQMERHLGIVGATDE